MMAEASALRTTINFSGFFLEHGKDTSDGLSQKKSSKSWRIFRAQKSDG
jgi:hypothetical protein